jgi:transmembrane sensor
MHNEIIFRVLTGRASAAEQAEVLAWRKHAAANEARYLEMARILRLIPDAQAWRTPGPRPSVEEVLARSDRPEEAAAHRGRSLVGAAGATFLRFRDSRGAVAAATVVLLAAGALYYMAPRESLLTPFGASQFITGPEESATVLLTDGTVVRLGESSRLRVPDGAEGREISVTGRAYFAVAHDADRPFSVHSDAGEVEVVGTRFTLDGTGDDLTVVVLEGHVALSTAGQKLEVGARQMARVMRGTPLPVMNAPGVEATPDWVGNFLAFQETPLRNAVPEIERRFDMSIEIMDSTLAERTITAWFSDWTATEVMEALCIVASAQCEQRDSVVAMRSSSWSR